MSEDRLPRPGAASGAATKASAGTATGATAAGSASSSAVQTSDAQAGGGKSGTLVVETAHVRALGGHARPAHLTGPRFDNRSAFDPVQIRLDGKTCRDLTRASKKEWLLTNGIGGYSMSTVAGLNTRRHHGLLVAQMRPPIGRAVVLSKMASST